jgi:hypothetical protein
MGSAGAGKRPGGGVPITGARTPVDPLSFGRERRATADHEPTWRGRQRAKRPLRPSASARVTVGGAPAPDKDEESTSPLYIARLRRRMRESASGTAAFSIARRAPLGRALGHEGVCVPEFERLKPLAPSGLSRRYSDESDHVCDMSIKTGSLDLPEKQKTAMCSRFPSGETRTRTGDTTIFRQRCAEPDGPRFPALKPVSAPFTPRAKVRKLHEMVGDVGHETPLMAQWSGRALPWCPRPVVPPGNSERWHGTDRR